MRLKLKEGLTNRSSLRAELALKLQTSTFPTQISQIKHEVQGVLEFRLFMDGLVMVK